MSEEPDKVDPIVIRPSQKKEANVVRIHRYVFRHSAHYGIFLGAVFNSYADVAKTVLAYQADSETFLVKYSTYCFVPGEVPDQDRERCRYRRVAYKCCKHPPVDRKKYAAEGRSRKNSTGHNCNFNFVVSYIKDIRMLRVTATNLGHDHLPTEEECRVVYGNMKKRNEKKWELIEDLRSVRAFGADYDFTTAPPHLKAKPQHGRDKEAIRLDVEQNTVEPTRYSDEIERKFQEYISEDMEKTDQARRDKEARQQAAKLAAENGEDINAIREAQRPQRRRRRRRARQRSESESSRETIYVNEEGRLLTEEEINIFVRGLPPKEPQYPTAEYETFYEQPIPSPETFGYYPSEERPDTNFGPQAPANLPNWTNQEFVGSQMPTEWYQIPEAPPSFGGNKPRAIQNSADENFENFLCYDENLPCYDENLPCYPENLPCYAENLPCYEENLPCYEENLPCYEENLVCYDENLPIVEEYAPFSQENRNFEVQNLQPGVIEHQPPVQLNCNAQNCDCYMADYWLNMDNIEKQAEHGQNQHPREVDLGLGALQLPELGTALDQVEEHLYQLLDDEEKKNEEQENVKPKCDGFDAENIGPNFQNGRPIQESAQGSRRILQNQSNNQGPKKTSEHTSDGQFKRPRGRPRKNAEGPPRKMKKKPVEETKPEFGVLDVGTVDGFIKADAMDYSDPYDILDMHGDPVLASPEPLKPQKECDKIMWSN